MLESRGKLSAATVGKCCWHSFGLSALGVDSLGTTRGSFQISNSIPSRLGVTFRLLVPKILHERVTLIYHFPEAARGRPRPCNSFKVFFKRNPEEMADLIESKPLMFAPCHHGMKKHLVSCWIKSWKVVVEPVLSILLLSGN